MNEKIKIDLSGNDIKIEKLTLRKFAQTLRGTLLQSECKDDAEIKGFTTLERAKEGEISFVTSAKFLDKAEDSKASFFIVPENVIVKGKPCVQLREVWEGVIFLMKCFYPSDIPNGEIDRTAVIDSGVKLGKNITIGPYVVISEGAEIGNDTEIRAHTFIGKKVKIGENCLIHPRVTILDHVEIGNRVILHSGLIIGSDGFKYEMIKGRLVKVPQVGTVIIEDDVEIGACTTIDRATLTETKIGAGTKIDNLVQIAHNVVIGEGCIIIAQTGIAGSSKLGKYCVLGGQVGIPDNITICDGVRAGARSAFKNNCTEPGEYLGTPALPAKEAARIMVAQKQLPELIKKVRELKNEVESLKQKIK